MWQKARIIDPDFEPIHHRGRELWVKDRPFIAEYHELLRTPNETFPYEDYNKPAYHGEWMLTNLCFSNGRKCRVWKDSIELLAEFKEDPPWEDVNSGELLSSPDK